MTPDDYARRLAEHPAYDPTAPLPPPCPPWCDLGPHPYDATAHDAGTLCRVHSRTFHAHHAATVTADVTATEYRTPAGDTYTEPLRVLPADLPDVLTPGQARDLAGLLAYTAEYAEQRNTDATRRP